MKNVIIVHGCPADKEKALDPSRRTYNKHWLAWLRKELQEKNVPAEMPMMPEPWAPNYESYKKEFERLEVNEETILVGHSCGCAFLVRWLGETKKSVAALYLVAPWKIPYREDMSDVEFYTYTIDASIKERVKQIVIFTSDNEEEDGKESARVFHEALGGEIVSLPNHGHYTEGDMGTVEFPELLKKILG